MIKKFEDNRLTESIHNDVSKSKTFDFLNDEEDIYLPRYLKEKYNG
jgi:hypothetical protein